MKIIKEDLKKGLIEVYIQSKEDCWHLYNIIEKGDFLSSLTYRSKKDFSDKVRSKKERKERVYLKIRVESKEFQEFTDRLRIRGEIVEGSEEIGAYHTFSIEPGMKIKIEKEWKEYHLKHLKEAMKKHPKIAVVAIDDEMATIARIHEYGVEEVATIYSNRSGKMYDCKDNLKEYYGQILSKIKELNLPVAIVGPGFEKEKFIELAKNEIKNYILDDVSTSGLHGIYEALKRGVIEKIMRENRVSMEIKIVEEIMERIAKNDKVAYGKEEVEKAIELGAVKKLVILNSIVKNEENLIKRAEKIGAKIEIINDFHEGGERLSAIGGIVAFLRYDI
ncbi:MAG TPA: mRNA surveillance protein pelota [Thermoplasmatales archaeon]|nr:mRNA surveillance protein pelota [Thermoplasmatales archaeon]